jgi:hypothetical protein
MIGGLPSIEPCNCCCDFGLTVSYATSGPASVLVLVSSTAARPTFTSCFVRIFRNGVLVVSVDNLTSSNLWGIPVNPGQTVTATVTATSNPACSFTQSCTRSALAAPQGYCEYFTPGSLVAGGCYTPAERRAGFSYNPSPITATISGLTGPMAVLNGSYTVDCEDTVAFEQVVWDAGASRGTVQVIWDNPYQARASATDRIGGVLSGSEFELIPVTLGVSFNIKPATCAPCTSGSGASWQAYGSEITRQSFLVTPASRASCAWSY